MNLRSLFGKKPDLHYWAQGVKQQDYDNLLNALRTYFKDHGTELEVNEAEGFATPKSGPLEGQQLGLHNLIRIVPGMKADDVQIYINNHFGKFLDMQVEQERIHNGTFDEVKMHLRLRLFYTDPANSDDPLYKFPGIQLCETLKACPMFDLEHSAMSVTLETFESWNMSIEELNQLALDQTFTEIERNGSFQKLDLSDGRPAFLVSDENIYFASIALDLKRAVIEEPRCGYLVFIPSRQSLLIQPLTNVDSVKHLLKLCEAANQMFIEAVGKVGPDAYWLKDGVLKRLELGVPGSGHPNISAMSHCIAN